LKVDRSHIQVLHIQVPHTQVPHIRSARRNGARGRSATIALMDVTWWDDG
jgi:hypothetical protein